MENSSEHATICLNMIVKNESHIIVNTLEKLCKKIKFDYWVICDTGSTDGTPQLITDFFDRENIKGELYHDEWVNFAHNRTLALQRAFKKTQLLLVFDADDEIIGNIVIPNTVLFDQYHLKLRLGNITFIRILMINNHKEFEYQSVIHEYIHCKENASSVILGGDYYVNACCAGSRAADPEKYLKDAYILEKAYYEAKSKNDNLYMRYAYYCANSYRDCGKNEDAIKWYKITLSHSEQWVQEKYNSCLKIYECSKKIDQEIMGLYYLVESFQYDCERVECLYHLLVHYSSKNMYKIAYNYYLNVKDFFENNYLSSDISYKLFMVPDNFTFYVPYYMIIISYHVKDYQCGIKMYEIIFTKKEKVFDEFYIKHLLFNLQFFLNHILECSRTSFINMANNYLTFLNENNVDLKKFDINNDYDSFGILIKRFNNIL